MNLCKHIQIPPGGITSPSNATPFVSVLTQPFPVITYLFQRVTECRGTGTAAYLAGNSAPCRLCSIDLTPITEERGDTDLHSCSLIKLFCCKHITQLQKGMTKASVKKNRGEGRRDLRKKVKPHKHNYAKSKENELTSP